MPRTDGHSSTSVLPSLSSSCVALLFIRWYFVSALRPFVWISFIETWWEEKNPWKYEFCENNTEALISIVLQCPHSVDVCACLVFSFLLTVYFFLTLSHGARAWNLASSHKIPLLFVFISFPRGIIRSWSAILTQDIFERQLPHKAQPHERHGFTKPFQISARRSLYLSMSQEAFPFALSPPVPFWWSLLYYVCKGPWYNTLLVRSYYVQ